MYKNCTMVQLNAFARVQLQIAWAEVCESVYLEAVRGDTAATIHSPNQQPNEQDTTRFQVDKFQTLSTCIGMHLQGSNCRLHGQKWFRMSVMDMANEVQHLMKPQKHKTTHYYTTPGQIRPQQPLCIYNRKTLV